MFDQGFEAGKRARCDQKVESAVTAAMSALASAIDEAHDVALVNRSFGGNHNPVELPIRWDDPDGRCETIRGTPIHPAMALAPLLIGRLRRQILTAKDRKVSRDTRLFDFDLKNALLILSRGRCTTFACDCPFMWLVADHVQPASLGGPTELDNGEIRCGTENAAKGNTPGI